MCIDAFSNDEGFFTARVEIFRDLDDFEVD